MRKLILLGFICSVFSVTSFADEKLNLWPNLTVWPTGMNLEIQNYTQFDYTCSGPIYINHASGVFTSDYYYGRVYSRYTERRYFFNNRINDRIISANHNIYCYRL